MMKEPSLFAGTTLPSDADAELVQQVRNGDASAFGPLIAKYQDRVYNACWRICGDAEEARDLTQDAFLRAFESMGRFSGQSSFYTWLFRIAVNLAISHRRKVSRRATISLEAEPDPRRINRQGSGLAATRAGGDDGPSARAEQREIHELLIAALDELDGEQRAVIVLKDMESMDYRQIGEILSVPVGTVKSRLHRARMAMRDKLRPVLDGRPLGMDRRAQ